MTKKSLATAQHYLGRGWAPIPLPFQTKAPAVKGWQRLRLTAEDLPQYFNGGPVNIGVLTGKPSHGLTDVDLDWPEAAFAATWFLPQTAAIFGRAGKPRSHMLYYPDPIPKYAKFIDPSVKGDDKNCILELRTDAHQTVFPGSVHPSGEPISWQQDGDPAHVEGAALRSQAGRLAACSLLARHWPQGSRQDAALYLSGGLWRAGWSAEDAEHFIAAVAHAANDEEPDKRRSVVEYTRRKLDAGERVTGWPHLAALVGTAVTDCVRRWLDVPLTSDATSPEQRTGQTAHWGTGEGPVVDGSNVEVQGGRFPRTDAGNGELFAQLHGDQVRFDHHRNRWLRWGGHWWAADTDGAVHRLAKETARHRHQAALDIEDQVDRAAEAKWAIGSEDRRRLDAALYQARSERPIAEPGEAWDADPWLLGVANGVVDLRTGEFRPGRQDDRITMRTPVPYDPGDECPRFRQFLREIFGGDAAIIDWIHRAAGYSITGETREQVHIICWGRGNNGKSTLLRVFREVAGDYGHNTPFSTLEYHARSSIPNDLAALYRRRLVTASELDEEVRLNEARLKLLAGQDPVTARFLHGEYFTFVPEACFWLAVNHRPIVHDDSAGFWRKIRLVPFTQDFSGREDKKLEHALRAEHPGILRWLVDGALRWQREGLAPPERIVAATRLYQEESADLADFLEACCTVHEQCTVAANRLYAEYARWVVDSRIPERYRLTPTLFGRRMGERYQKVHTRQGSVYQGVGLRADISV